jgi:ATPase subunit of ABC transporter with duplicated ATPase domains
MSIRTASEWIPNAPHGNWCLAATPFSLLVTSRYRLGPYLAAFGFKGPDQQKPAHLFSGGERSRLNLALTLKEGSNVLLLDEPTNDLDIETLVSLENALLEFPGCIMVSAHDRWFLDRVATHILAWEGTNENPAGWFWFEGNYAGYKQNKIERLGIELACRIG